MSPNWIEIYWSRHSKKIVHSFSVTLCHSMCKTLFSLATNKVQCNVKKWDGRNHIKFQFEMTVRQAKASSDVARVHLCPVWYLTAESVRSLAKQRIWLLCGLPWDQQCSWKLKNESLFSMVPVLWSYGVFPYLQRTVLYRSPLQFIRWLKMKLCNV